jgi:hypothetical protein
MLFLATAVTGWLILQGGGRNDTQSRSVPSATVDLGFQHSQRLQIAVARAAADVLGMSTAQSAGYQADYHLQQMQIQADSEGLDRWAAHDIKRQGLLQEIRASLAAFRIALDQTSGAATTPIASLQIPLLPALNRAETALSNYSASLSQPNTSDNRASEDFGHMMLAGLFLAELAALAWLFFFDTPARKNVSLP